MHEALTALLQAHTRALGFAPPETIPLRPVPHGQPGDWSTALAHTVAGGGQPAAALAADLAARLRGEPDLAEVRSDGGYLIVTMAAPALAEGAGRLLLEPAARVPAAPADHRWPAQLEPVALAHARCRNVARAAHAHGVRPLAGEELEPALTAVVEEESSRALMVLLGAFARRDQTPAVLAASETEATRRAVHVLVRRLAARYQEFYARTRTAPRGAEPVTSSHRTHLTLTEATAVALATGLSTLGEPAPEHL